MRIRTKLLWLAVVFSVASGGIMTWCYQNIRREENAFARSHRSVKTLAAVSDIEYFLVRQVRMLESYLLLGDESERLQLVQANQNTRTRLEQWKKEIDRGEADGEEWGAVRSVHENIAVASNKVRLALRSIGREKAVVLMEKDFTPVSSRALETFKQIRKKLENDKKIAEEDVVQELTRNHMGIMAGMLLIASLGLVSILTFQATVLRPIRKMRQWADRVARGEKPSHMRGFKGRNELTELAQSIGEMGIQLTRPRANPPVPPRPISKPLEPETKAPAVATKTESTALPEVPSPESLGISNPVEPPSASPNPSSATSSPPSVSPLEPVPPPVVEKAAPAPPPPITHAEDFELAVNEFRDLLGQMAGKA